MLYNGPFILTRWVHGASLRMDKNPNYWNASKVNLDAIDAPYITPDDMARFNLFKDKKIDILGLSRNNLANAQLAFEEAEFALRKQKSEVLALMGKAQHAYTEVDGVRYRVASRQSRAGSKPFLVINKKGNK